MRRRAGQPDSRNKCLRSCMYDINTSNRRSPSHSSRQISMNASRFASQRLRGFSLVELIVVMVIISIIATFVVPAASTIIRGSQITQAAQMITDQISFARQIALTKNKTIEVRFIKYADPETPGEDVRNPDSGRFRAIQLMEVTEAGIAVPTSKLQVIPRDRDVESRFAVLSVAVQDADHADRRHADVPGSAHAAQRADELPLHGFSVPARWLDRPGGCPLHDQSHSDQPHELVSHHARDHGSE